MKTGCASRGPGATASPRFGRRRSRARPPSLSDGSMTANHLSGARSFSPGESHVELRKNNKHFQGFSKESADRWGLRSFLATETDFEERGEVGSTLGDSVLLLPGKEPARAVNSEHPGPVGAGVLDSWIPGTRHSAASSALTSPPSVPATMPGPPKCPPDSQPQMGFQPRHAHSRGLVLGLHATRRHQDSVNIWVYC